jgi:outer membrane translocation and assembly module TamA
MDHVKNPHYPRSGFRNKLTYNIFPGFLGNENISQKIDFEHNHYFPVRQNKDVLAARLFVGLTPGNPGFNQQYIVGRKDIRGYTQGEFRGNYMVAAQGEYRWNFHRRWGAVGFAGVATLFKALNASDNGKILPGAGGGIRFIAFPENHFSVGLDVAAGISDWGIYFQIGQAF